MFKDFVHKNVISNDVHRSTTGVQQSEMGVRGGGACLFFSITTLGYQIRKKMPKS